MRILPRLRSNRSCHVRDNGGAFLFVFAEKRIEKTGFAHVTAQLPPFEEDVNRFPKRVIKNFHDFLVNEGVRSRGYAEIRASRTRQRKGHSAAPLSKIQRCPNFSVSMGRTESHHNVIGSEQ